MSLTDVFSTHYKACKEDRSQLRLFHAPVRMKQNTAEGGFRSLEIIMAPESLSALADAHADAPALRPVSDSQTVQSLLEGELSEERSGTGPADVDQQPIDDDENDEPIDDEYELLCNEAEDAVARSDAALADCSKDEEKTVERAQVASVDEKTASHWHSTQGPTKSLARWSTICGKHTVNQLC